VNPLHRGPLLFGNILEFDEFSRFIDTLHADLAKELTASGEVLPRVYLGATLLKDRSCNGAQLVRLDLSGAGADVEAIRVAIDKAIRNFRAAATVIVIPCSSATAQEVDTISLFTEHLYTGSKMFLAPIISENGNSLLSSFEEIDGKIDGPFNNLLLKVAEQYLYHDSEGFA
jgi:hypothetical protein